MNNSGQVVFGSGLFGNGVTSGTNTGIYTNAGIDMIEVVRKGNVIDDASVLFHYFDETGLNKYAQVAYGVQLSNGSEQLRVLTPELHWRSTSGGSSSGFSSSTDWDDGNNWTLGLNPGMVHDVFIGPATNVEIDGPLSNTTVHSLQIGGGAGEAQLNLQSGATLTALEMITIEANGSFGGEGSIVGDIINNGSFVPTDIMIDGDFTMNSTSDSAFELDGTNVGEFDQLVVTGDLAIDGTLTANLEAGFQLSMDITSSFEIIQVGGTMSGEFDGLSEGSLVANLSGVDVFISYAGGNSVVLFIAIPEPTSALILTGLATVVATRRRRR